MQGKVIKRFTDKESLEVYHAEDIYETKSKERLEYLSDLGFLEIVKEEKKEKETKPVNRKK